MQRVLNTASLVIVAAVVMLAHSHRLRLHNYIVSTSIISIERISYPSPDEYTIQSSPPVGSTDKTIHIHLPVLATYLAYIDII